MQIRKASLDQVCRGPVLSPASWWLMLEPIWNIMEMHQMDVGPTDNTLPIIGCVEQVKVSRSLFVELVICENATSFVAGRNISGC